MKPIYHHYTKWEDFQNGMYNEEKDGRKERIQKAIQILSTGKLCCKAMRMVTSNWKYACEQNLSNNIYGHRAFLGQAACNIYAGVHEDETRQAWGMLTDDQRKQANGIADMIYREWMDAHESNAQMTLFEGAFA